MGEIVRRAAEDARALAGGGVDAVLIENMHDTPYLRREVGPEIIAAMSVVATTVRAVVDLPIGIQVLAGANRAALSIAHASGCQFIRAEGFVHASVADEGLLEEADAGPLLRHRRMIGAEDVRILADVQKKHSSHAITADVDTAEAARAAAFFRADAVAISGRATGEAADLAQLESVRSSVTIPVVAGSGVTPRSVAATLRHADAIIAGSALKREGRWYNELDQGRIAAMVEAVAKARRAR